MITYNKVINIDSPPLSLSHSQSGKAQVLVYEENPDFELFQNRFL